MHAAGPGVRAARHPARHHRAGPRGTLATFTELGRTTGQALADGHRELARHLFAGLPTEAFDGFEGGLRHVVNQLRALLSQPTA